MKYILIGWAIGLIAAINLVLLFARFVFIDQLTTMFILGAVSGFALGGCGALIWLSKKQ